MAKRTEYSNETKAAAMAALLEGQSVSKVAKDFKIPGGTIRFWNSHAKAQIESAANPVATQKRELLGALIIEGLEQNLKTCKTLAKFFETTSWLNGQSAEGLAVLYGVMSDKAVRLLEALSARGDESSPDAGPSA